MDPKKKIYFLLSVCVILILAIVILGVYPAFKEIQENADGFISKKNEILVLDQEIRNFDQIKDKYQSHWLQVDNLGSLFVLREMPIDFTRFLQDLASSSSLPIVISIPPSGEKGNERWEYFTYNLSLEGSFSNFARFLEKLENSPYLIKLENMNITQQEAIEGKAAGIRASLLIKVYAR